MNFIQKAILVVAAIATLAFNTILAFANTGNADGMSEGKSFANSFLGSIREDAENGSENIGTLLPQLDTTSGAEQASFDNPGDLNDKGYQKASVADSNESYALSTVQSQATDLTYTIGADDPMMQNLKRLDQGVTGLISNNYEGCTSLPVNSNNNIFTQQSCYSNFLTTNISFSCVKKFTSICQNPLAGQPKQFNLDDFKVTPLNALAQGSSLPVTQISPNKFRFGKYGDNYRWPGGGCNWYEDEISFDANGKDISKFFISRLRYDDKIEIIVNGQVAISDIGGRCERNKTSSSPDIDISEKLTRGINKIKIRHEVSGGGEIAFMFDIESEEPCDAIESYQTTCDGNYNPYGAEKLSESCVGGYKTAENGDQVCLEAKTNYRHLGEQWRKNQACQALDNSTCLPKGEVCVSYNNDGECTKKELQYDCPTTDTTDDQVMCGDTLICPGGDCSTDMGRDQIDGTDDFKHAMASLGVAGELSEGIGADMLSVFKAEGKKCKKKPFGIADCCSDSGWGLDFSLAQCTAEEKEIGIAKDKETTIYLGQYEQKEDSLGLVVSKVKAYCVYPSKLSRIIAEQGKPQLGQGFGSAKNPDCSGFTVDELSALDFNAIDLSEFHSDVMENQSNADGLNLGNAMQKIENSLTNTFGANSNE